MAKVLVTVFWNERVILCDFLEGGKPASERLMQLF